MRGRFLIPLAAVAAVALLAMQPAGAQDEYPPEEPLLSVSAGTVVVGGSVVLTGTGFDPGEEIAIEASTSPLAAPQFGTGPEESEPVAMVPVAHTTSLLAGARAQDTVTADGEGSFTVTVTLTEVGRTTITATGLESGLSASVVVVVVAAADGLPATGSSGWPLLRIGAAVLGLGVVLVLTAALWRYRRTRAGT
jgi:hypothetical protein